MSSYVGWIYIKNIFGCGRNKAMKILHMQPKLIYVGRTPMVAKADFHEWLEECGNEIKVQW